MTQYAIPYVIIAAAFLCYSLNSVQDDVVKPMAVAGSLLWPLWLVVAAFVMLCALIIMKFEDMFEGAE